MGSMITTSDRLTHYCAWLARNRQAARDRFFDQGGLALLMILDWWHRQEERWV